MAYDLEHKVVQLLCPELHNIAQLVAISSWLASLLHPSRPPASSLLAEEAVVHECTAFIFAIGDPNFVMAAWLHGYNIIVQHLPFCSTSVWHLEIHSMVGVCSSNVFQSSVDLPSRSLSKFIAVCTSSDDLV